MMHHLMRSRGTYETWPAANVWMALDQSPVLERRCAGV